MDFQTKLIHSGEPKNRVEGAVVLPIFQSAQFTCQGEDSYDELKYIRLNNTPNHAAIQAKVASIAGGEAALVTGSGMAAISGTLMTYLQAGDHLLVQNCLYGGTHSFVTQDLTGMGVEVEFVPGNEPAVWESRAKPNTRVIYFETMTNPLLDVADLEGVVQFAKSHGLISIIDNTFASPMNFRPLEAGFDLSVHSATKYLNGHSDIVAGCVIGKQDRVAKIVHRMNHLGGCLDPHACFLLHRGIKTLALRMRQHNENGLVVARLLSEHPLVRKVNYPGLADHPQHERATNLFSGFGGVLSFEVNGSVEKADELISQLNLAVIAPSLGGVETLITRPATTSHSGLSPAERAASGISDGLIRVALGIESSEDLCKDFKQALDSCA